MPNFLSVDANCVSLSKKMLLVAITGIFALTSCSDDKKEPKEPKDLRESQGLGSLLTGSEKGALQLKVTSPSGAPIEGVKIYQGVRGMPVEGTTNSQGMISFFQDSAEDNLITAVRQGWVTSSVLKVKGPYLNLILREAPQQQQTPVELRGVTTGYTIKNGDGLIDFSVTLPAFFRDEILDFSLNRVISSKNDTIEILGKTAQIPSNVTFPEQKERYAIINVKLAKPTYRNYFPAPGTYNFYSLSGRFPFKPFVDDYRKGKAFFELLNYFSYTGGTFLEVNLNNSTQIRDIPVNQFTFNQTTKLATPKTQPEESVLVGVFTSRGESLLPTDIKIVDKPGTLNLLTDNPQAAIQVAVLQRTAEISIDKSPDRLSLALSQPGRALDPLILPLLEDPTVISPTQVKAPAVSTDMKFAQKLMRATLSQRRVQINQEGQLIESRQPLWEVYAPDWLDEVELPNLAELNLPNQGLHWMITFAGSHSAEVMSLSPQSFSKVSHATSTGKGF
jgi:hypothetical protein